MTLGMSKVLQEKWAPVLDHGDLDPITDNYKKACLLYTSPSPRDPH